MLREIGVERGGGWKRKQKTGVEGEAWYAEF